MDKIPEYIERESIKYRQIEIGGYSGNTWITDCELVAYKRDIESIPAADVRPVVLCRDCVNYGEMLSGYDHRLICHKFALTTKPNFYCACGERRNFGTDMREES